jgi:large subunit ribosomal protein L30e
MTTKDELRDMIHSSIKAGSAVFGFNQSLDLIKKGLTKSVIVSNNAPDERLSALKESAKASSVELQMFDGDSKELGVMCGKPFPILVLVIRK